jgi:hypothetical protein
MGNGSVPKQPIVFAAVILVACGAAGLSSASLQPLSAPAPGERPSALCAKRALQATGGRAARSPRLLRRRARIRRRCLVRIRRAASEPVGARNGHPAAPGADAAGRHFFSAVTPIEPLSSPGEVPSSAEPEPPEPDPGSEPEPPSTLEPAQIPIDGMLGEPTAEEEGAPPSKQSPEAEGESEPPTEPEGEPESPPEQVPEPEESPEPEASPDPGLSLDPDPGLAIGIDGHYASWPRTEIRDRTALGAAVTRHEWDPENPVTSDEQPVYEGATAIHTRIHALLGGNEIGDPAHYRDWVVAFVQHWGPGGSYWDTHPELDESRYAISTIELGNEPYFGDMTASEYADAVRPTLERIAELSLPVRVVLPSYIHGANTGWIDTLYARIPNLNSLFYAFADHPYWYGHHPADDGNNGPFERIETLRGRMNHHGAAEKPIYITEYGESTAGCGSECVDEATQAAHLTAMLDAVLSHPEWDVEVLSIYQLRDRGTNSPDREQQFGLLREDGTPKPAHPLLREAMQQYRG